MYCNPLRVLVRISGMLPFKLISIVLLIALGWRIAYCERAMMRREEGIGRPELLQYLALGDSYTVGEAVSSQDRYPVQVTRLLRAKDHLACGEPEVIAATGWTTENLLMALRPGSTYDLVSILIGVNNQYQGRSEAEYAEQFERLLQQCIRFAGDRPGLVVVLSIPDYSVTPFGRTYGTARVAAQIDSFNRINAALAERYSVRYIDITTASRKAAGDPSLIAPDGLHFSGKEYAVWAQLMEPLVREIVK